MLGEAIQTYHDLLTDDLAAASQEQLSDGLRRRGLYFGERPLSSVLRPRFMTPDMYRYLQQRARLVLSAFDKSYRAAMVDASMRAQFGLFDWEEEFLRYDPGFHEPCPTARLDSFFVPETGELRFIEYNAETQAAVAYNDVLAEVVYGLPAMRRFLRRYEVRPTLARHNLLHVLLDCYEQWGGRGERPRIAIVDWREVPTYSEFVLFEEYFRSHGLECVIADPRELEYTNGRLMAGDFHVNLVYKRILFTELVEQCGLDHPLVRAVRDHAVCMVNPLHGKVLYKKASLAVLSDERNHHLFTPDEIRAVDEHVPWTRRVAERHTLYQGRVIELIPFILEQREMLVLKSNDEYGGKGVVLGWQTEPAEWERAVLSALEGVWVIQKRVSLPSEPYPVLIDGRVELVDHIVDTDPFAFYGEFAEGCLTRISTQDLLNVTAGTGSTIPSMIVERR